MTDYRLDADEVLLVECENVSPIGNKLFNTNGTLALTNKNVLFVTFTIFGKVKNIEKWSLSNIKVFNDMAQARLETKFGESPELTIYYKNDQRGYTMYENSKAKEFVNQLNKLVTGKEMNVTNSGLASGAAILGQTLRETANAFKTAFGIKEKEPEKTLMVCPGCAATVTGIKGSITKCEYCGTSIKLV